MSTKKTPLLQLLRTNSGTVYVFPSASEDVGLNLNSDVYSIALTHYALLNIPPVSLSKLCFGQDSELYAHNDIGNINPNQLLAMSLQNYVMNFETVLLNQEGYNFLNLKTVSERVFWHWMKAIGAFDTELVFDVDVDNSQYYYHFEPDSRIVQCFGSIDSGNKVHSEFGMFNETYINIPSSYGAGPVFFESIFDENYKAGTNYQSTSGNYLEGRSDDNFISYSMNHDKPYFDTVNSYYVEKPDTGNKQTLFEGLEIVKDFDSLSKIIKNVTASSAELPILSYDELNVDPQNRLYKRDKENETGDSLVRTEFDFNAILLYYSVYDQNDIVSRVHATNLFGIIFLDGADVIQSKNKETSEPELQLYIPTYNKRKSLPERFGTGYSFRINVKTLSIYDDTHGVIQDNTTTAAVDANNLNAVVQTLNTAVNIMNTNMHMTIGIQDSYAKILHIYDEQRLDIDDISTLLHNYVEGKTNPVLNVDKLYTDEINVKTEAADRIRIMMPIIGQEGYIEGVTPFTEVAAFKSNGLYANNIYGDNIFENNYYVIRNYYRNDYPITTDPETFMDSASSADNTTLSQMLLDTTNLVLSMFEPSRDSDGNKNDYKLKVNLRGETITTDEAVEGGGAEERYRFKLYIDPESEIFDADNGISHLKTTYRPNNIIAGDDIKVIDYVGLIPYMIAEMQLLNNYSYTPLDNYDSINASTDIKNFTIKEALNYVLLKQSNLLLMLNDDFQADDLTDYVQQIVDNTINNHDLTQKIDEIQRNCNSSLLAINTSISAINTSISGLNSTISNIKDTKIPDLTAKLNDLQTYVDTSILKYIDSQDTSLLDITNTRINTAIANEDASVKIAIADLSTNIDNILKDLNSSGGSTVDDASIKTYIDSKFTELKNYIDDEIIKLRVDWEIVNL